MDPGASVDPVAAIADEESAIERGIGWRDLALPLGSLAVLLAVLVLVQSVGMTNRHFEPTQVKRTVPDANGVFGALTGLGLRGRIVLLVGPDYGVLPTQDTYTFTEALAKGQTSAPTDSQTLSLALATFGIARAEYVVSPTAVGETGQGGMSRMNGTPLTRIAESSLPDFGEKAIVVLEASSTGQYDPATVARLIAPGAADVVITQEKP
jgi:hypothetical protein